MTDVEVVTRIVEYFAAERREHRHPMALKVYAEATAFAMGLLAPESVDAELKASAEIATAPRPKGAALLLEREKQADAILDNDKLSDVEKLTALSGLRAAGKR